jgi:hypothetical protein
MELNKRDNENELEFIKRLVYGKLVDKTITTPYEELSELIFGEGNNFNESEVRKRCYGIKRILDLLEVEKEKNIDDDDILKELEIKKTELEKERKKLQATKIEYNRNLRIDSRFELLYENIKNNIKELPIPEFERLYIQEFEKSYLLNFSDIHYGATFKSETNEYSREICKQRFEILLNEVIKLIQDKGINKLYIVNNGDTLQGLLRVSDVRMNDIPIVEATIEVSKLLASWLNELSRYVEVVYYHVPSANHTELRLLNSPAGQMAAEDLEKIIVNYIHDLLINNSRIEVPVTTDKDYITFKLLDYNFIAMHGHQIKSVENALRDLSMLHRIFYDTLLLGHYHGGKEIIVGEGETNSTEIIVSPSIVGSDPYSDSLLKGSKSMAKLYEYEQYKGRVASYNIILN